MGWVRTKVTIQNICHLPRTDFLLLHKKIFVTSRMSNTMVNTGTQLREALESCHILLSTSWGHCHMHSKSGFWLWRSRYERECRGWCSDISDLDCGDLHQFLCLGRLCGFCRIGKMPITVASQPLLSLCMWYKCSPTGNQ